VRPSPALSPFAPGLPLVFAALAVVATGLDACKGCSSECTGPKNQGAETCPCSSDQDCTTRLGIVLLCVDGTCTKGNPDDVPGPACTANADCGAGQACGIDQFCLPAPKCERIDASTTAPISARVAGAAAGVAVTATRDDCNHTWSATSGASSMNVGVSIDLNGTMTVTDNGGDGCTGGDWFAPQRMGELDCGSTTWAIGASDVIAHACVGSAECTACGATLVGNNVGVCP
jgi:hypothetical protein